MNLEKLTRRVTEELKAALPEDMPADERKAVVDIVRQAMQDSSEHTHREMKGVAVHCCGPEADLAHKLQEEMDKKSQVLVSNLSAMR